MKLIDLSEISEHKVAINADNITEVIDNSDYFIGNYDYAQKVFEYINKRSYLYQTSNEVPSTLRNSEWKKNIEEAFWDAQFRINETKEFWGITEENHHERTLFIGSLSSNERKAYYLELHKNEALTILKTTHGDYELSITFKEFIERFGF